MKFRIFKNPIATFFLIGPIFLLAWLVFINIIIADGRRLEIVRIVENINHEYVGVVTRKYSVRKGVKPTFLEIKDQNGKFWNISPNYVATENISVGDSIVKIRGENLIRVKTTNGTTYQFIYELISKSQRNHPAFPDEWSDKWPEATR